MFIESRDPVMGRALSITPVLSTVDDIGVSDHDFASTLFSIVRFSPRALGTAGSSRQPFALSDYIEQLHIGIE